MASVNIVVIDANGIIILANKQATLFDSSFVSGKPLQNATPNIKHLHTGEWLISFMSKLTPDVAEPVAIYSPAGAFEGQTELSNGHVMVTWNNNADWSHPQISESFKLRSILEGTQAGTWEWNVATGEVRVNERWALILGYRLDELAPVTVDTWRQLIHPDDAENSYNLLHRHFQGLAEYYECEMRLQRKDGSWCWVRNYGRIVSKTADGKVAWVVGTYIDITHIVALRQRQQDMFTELHTIVTSTPSIIFKSRMDDGFSANFISEDVTEKLGYAVDEVINASQWWFNALHPDDKQQTLEQFSRWLEGNTHRQLCRRYRLQHKAGHFLWVEERIQALRDGEYVGSLSIVEEEENLKARLEELAKLVPGVIYQFLVTKDGNMSFSYSSPRITDIFGVTPEEAADSAKTVLDSIHPDDLENVIQTTNDSAASLSEWVCEYRVKHGDKGYRWVYGHSLPKKLANGDLLYNGMIVDISDKKLLENKLTESRDRLRRAHKIGRLGHWEANLETGTLFRSDMVYELLGLDKSTFTPTVDAFSERVHPDDIAAVKMSEAHASQTGIHDVEHRLRHSAGHYIWVHELADMSGDGITLVGTVRDITRQKELELHLKALSVTDELTQVYNRRFFISALTNELSRFERQGAPFCVCVIDFDYFKMINDRYGHQAGDLVLVEISRIIGQRLRKTDLFARLGGEEFAVLMPDTRLNEAKVVAENITKRVRDARVKTPTNDIDITVTIGIAQVQRGSTWMDVLKQADDALYQGKRNGRDTIEVST